MAMMRVLALVLLWLCASPASAWTHGAGAALTSIVPTSGGTAGGTVVTITGVNLASATNVKFGASSASSFSCTATTCTATSPAGSGTETVTVVTPGGIPGGLSFLFQDFTQSFVAGTTDPSTNCSGSGCLIDGTELRDLLFTTVLNGKPLPDGTTCAKSAGCPILLGFTGFWEDNACSVGQGPQAIALTKSLGVATGSLGWYLDKQFAGTTPCGGGQFNVVNSAYDYFVTYDGSGNAVSPTLEVVLVGGTDKSIYARNNALGTWPNFTFTGGSGVNRAIRDHEDDSSGATNSHVDYALLGNDNDGIHDATTTVTGSPPTLSSFTINATAENWCQNWTSGTTCNTTCSPNNIANCTNLDTEWPFNLTVTSGSSTGSAMTLNWTGALQAPLSPSYSQVAIRGVTGAAGCTAVNTGTQTVTGQTSTSVTVAATGTSCGYGSATVSTPSQVLFGWTGALGAALAYPCTVTIASVTGYVGDNPNGTQTINYSTTTSLQFSSNTNCNSCTGGTITNVSCATISKSITSASSGVAGNLVGSSIRIIGITDCPVTSGGNTAGKASFSVAGMNAWRRVDNGASSFQRLAGVIPWPSAGFPTGQPQWRGLTCVATADSTHYPNGYELLGHIEGDGGMWAMNPDTGIFIKEDNLLTEIQSQWGWGTYGIDAYNSEGIYPITVGGKAYYMFGEGDAYAVPVTQPYELTGALGNTKTTAYSGFWVRATTSPASPTAPSYTVFPTSGAQQQAILNQIAITTPQPPAVGGSSYNPCAGGGSGNCPLMISSRAGPLVSLFPEDGGQVLFFGGFDANSTAVHSTAWIGRAPVSMFSWP